jgi:hypothetical protein
MGYFYGNPDASGNYQSGGLVLHIGMGIGTPAFFSVNEAVKCFKGYAGPTYLQQQK